MWTASDGGNNQLTKLRRDDEKKENYCKIFVSSANASEFIFVYNYYTVGAITLSVH